MSKKKKVIKLPVVTQEPRTPHVSQVFNIDPSRERVDFTPYFQVEMICDDCSNHCKGSHRLVAYDIMTLVKPSNGLIYGYHKIYDALSRQCKHIKELPKDQRVMPSEEEMNELLIKAEAEAKFDYRTLTRPLPVKEEIKGE